MSHHNENDSEYTEFWGEERTQCKNCTSLVQGEDGKYYCLEGKCEVPLGAHCDYFQSID